MSGRIKYIDALRGLAMLMVVMVHVEGFSVFIEEFHMSFFRRICEALMLPLFFFISGYLSKPISGKRLLMKCTQLLVPSIILGLLYSCYIHKDPVSFIRNIYKYGYWFTLTLVEMLVTINLITKLNRKNQYSGFIILFIAALLYLIKILFNNIRALDCIGDIFCMHQFFIYFHYFAVGYVLSNNKTFLSKLLSTQPVITLAISIFCFSIFVRFTYTDEQLATNVLLKMYRFVQDPVLGYTGIIVLFKMFHDKQSLLSDGLVGRVLQCIGRHTLEIYLLHYFFLPKLPELGIVLVQSPNLVIEAICVMLLSLLVITVSIALGKILSANSIIRFLLLGAKPHFFNKTEKNHA